MQSGRLLGCAAHADNDTCMVLWRQLAACSACIMPTAVNSTTLQTMLPPPLCAVDEAITAQQLDLTEAEFARLLQAAAAGSSWERAQGVLRRIGSELTVMSPTTLRRVRELFASPAAAAAFAAAPGAAGSASGGSWEVGPTTVSPTGQCASCGGQLAASDLSDEEFAMFAQGVAAIAEKQERRPNDFQQVGAAAEAVLQADSVVWQLAWFCAAIPPPHSNNHR